MMTADDEFWDRLQDIEAGMLGFLGKGPKMPVAPSLRDDDDGSIWFITTQGLPMVTALTLGPHKAEFVIADGKSGFYAAITGDLTLVDNDDIIDELWSPVVAGWLAEPEKAVGLRLLRFVPQTGSAWYSTVNGVRFLYDVARAQAPNLPSPAGWNAQLAFSHPR